MSALPRFLHLPGGNCVVVHGVAVPAGGGFGVGGVDGFVVHELSQTVPGGLPPHLLWEPRVALSPSRYLLSSVWSWPLEKMESPVKTGRQVVEAEPHSELGSGGILSLHIVEPQSPLTLDVVPTGSVSQSERMLFSGIAGIGNWYTVRSPPPGMSHFFPRTVFPLAVWETSSHEMPPLVASVGRIVTVWPPKDIATAIVLDAPPCFAFGARKTFTLRLQPQPGRLTDAYS